MMASANVQARYQATQEAELLVAQGQAMLENEAIRLAGQPALGGGEFVAGMPPEMR